MIMNFFVFHPWLLLYPVAGVLSLILAFRIVKGRSKTLASKNFLFFSLSIFLWDLLVFLHRVVSSEVLSKILFNLASIFYTLSPFFLLMTVLFIWKKNLKFYLLVIPAIILYVVYILFSKTAVVQTEYGWSYVMEFNILLVMNYLNILFYSILICSLIIFIIRRVKNSIIRKKYLIILISFILFYLIGVLGLNLVLYLNPHMPPPGGISTFLLFLGVGYAFSLRESVVLEPKAEEVRSLLFEEYASFIRKFLEVAPSKELGESMIELERYLIRVGLIDILDRDSEGKLVLKPDVLNKANLIKLADETLNYLEDRPWSLGLTDNLLPVLNMIYVSTENKNEFRRMVVRHEDFLKRTDMLYGLINREFLLEVEKDDSLKDFPSWLACLRLCRRLILVLLQDFYSIVGDSIESKILSFSILKDLKVSKFGKVDTSKLEKTINTMPQDERIQVLLDNFVPFIAWMIEELYERLGEKIEDNIRYLRITLGLSMEVALRTMIYNNLIDSLSNRIPLQYVSMLKLSEGFTIKDLTRFSAKVNLDHSELIGRSILLEFEPGNTYFEYIKDYVTEALAHGETSIIVTRKGSPLQDKLQDLRSIRFIHPSLMVLTTMFISELEVHVPLQDVVQVLESLGRSVKSSSSPVFIVFDSLTDFMIQYGFEKTYRLIRSILELAPSKASLLIPLNVKAWGENVRSTLEELLNIHVHVS